LAITAINAWNRIAVSSRMVAASIFLSPSPPKQDVPTN